MYRVRFISRKTICWCDNKNQKSSFVEALFLPGRGHCLETLSFCMKTKPELLHFYL